MRSFWGNTFFYALGVLVVGITFGGRAVAAEPKNDSKITVDFSLRQVQFFGIYAPYQGGKKGGLDAEILARRNGIMNLSTRLKGSCGSAESAQTSNPGWQGSVKSQGSEIYSNGVLKISLVAPLREVFKDIARKPATLRTKEGNPIALRFPRLTLASFKCGLLSVNVAGKTVNLNPLSSSSESGAKVVNLELDGSALRPTSAADVALLENSNLFGAPESNSDATEVPAAPSNSAPATAN
ncbi:MAG: hypothetical protein FJY29_08440 [Betaproteobacteria bacterium]|nr:hypothetical protein [Betaproteobacteria bacterium]